MVNRGKTWWRKHIAYGYGLQSGLTLFLTLFFVIALIIPLGELLFRAFMDETGSFVGLRHFQDYFRTPALFRSLSNTIFVSTLTMLFTVVLAFPYAYGIVRSKMPGGTIFRLIAILPLLAPSMLQGIGLIYLFGNQGLFTTGFFGYLPRFDLEIYGALGIVIAEVAYAFPQAVLIFIVGLSMTDYRLYEAANMLGAGSIRTFFTVTLPSVRYSLTSALFITFTTCFVDFGAPKIIGGQYSVIATELYKQVVGQQKLNMGAAVGLILLVPAVLSFFVDRVMSRKRSESVGSGSIPYQIKSNSLRDWGYFSYCTVLSTMILALIGAIILAATIKNWPYDLSFTTQHFNFDLASSGGMSSLLLSLEMAAWTAVFGTLLVFLNAYSIEKLRMLRVVRQLNYLFSLVPLALPGLVVGLAYIFFFNRAGWTIESIGLFIKNPFHVLYGTLAILVLSNIIHYYSVPFVTATTALKKLDKEFEVVAESMGVPFFQTLRRVTFPMCLPAIIEISGYFFVTAMTTVSAVVFLYASDLKPASVMIINMEDAGDVAAAAAMTLVLLVINLVVRILYSGLGKVAENLTGDWLKRDE